MPAGAGPLEQQQQAGGALDEVQEDMLRVGTALRNIGWLRWAPRVQPLGDVVPYLTLEMPMMPVQSAATQDCRD